MAAGPEAPAALPDASHRLAPFNPSATDAIDTALGRLLALTADDVFLDVGCGDGRLLVAAVQRAGCRAVGIEYDPALAERARVRAREAGVEDRVEVREADALAVDFASLPATAVFLYLKPEGLAAIQPLLQPLYDRGARVATHMFRVRTGGWRLVESVPVGVISMHLYRKDD